MAGRLPDWTEEKVACLKRHLALGTPRSVIQRDLGYSLASIDAKTAELGLRPRAVISAGEKRKKHARKVGDLRHRAALGFRNPIRLQPPRSLFGAPIRVLDPATRALIDEALDTIGKGYTRPPKSWGRPN